VERVFSNLIGNALEAMPDGGDVRITAEMRDGAVVVRTEDNGPGSRRIRSQLFQLVSAGKRNGGLATAPRQTVMDHGETCGWSPTCARRAFRPPDRAIAQAQSLHV
jgi:nitrogen fixation/metabolism regulation signal transduction histidine kinase